MDKLAGAKWLIRCTLLTATLYLVHAYAPMHCYISLSQYKDGLERMPFQGRMLLMYPMRWAASSAGLQRFTKHLNGMRSPETLVVFLAGLFGVILTGFVIERLYRQISTNRQFGYIPYSLMLVLILVMYVFVAYQFPYDLLAMAFFTTGMYLIYNRRFWWLLVLFLVASFNRETTLFLIPLIVLDAVASEDGLEWKRVKSPALLGKVALLSIVWLATQAYVHERFAGRPSEMGPRMMVNLAVFKQPQMWPAFFAAGGFLIPLVLLFRKRIPDPRIRSYIWVIPLWIAFMFVYGQVLEIRIYGELSGLLALSSVLIFESSLEGKIQSPRTVPT